MKQYLIMCRSATSAYRGAKLLEASLIRAGVVKAPKALSARGCTYALKIFNKLESAIAILRKNGVSFGKIYAAEQADEWKEVVI